MKRPLALLVALPLLAACPPERPPEPEIAPEPEVADAPLEIGPAPEPSEAIPDGVLFARNPDYDAEAGQPTEAPPLDAGPARTAYQALAADHERALAEACAEHPERVIRLAREGTRIGYVAFRDFELRVPGMFEEFGGFGLTGDDAEVTFWTNAASLNSGDEARDGNLLKHFFRVENPLNAPIVYRANGIGGLENGLPEDEGASVDVALEGTFELHGNEGPLTVPLTITRRGDGWDAVPSAELLLPFRPFDLIGALPATVRACNHVAIGTSVELALQMRLVPGCPAGAEDTD